MGNMMKATREEATKKRKKKSDLSPHSHHYRKYKLTREIKMKNGEDPVIYDLHLTKHEASLNFEPSPPSKISFFCFHFTLDKVL